jgi:hypothetical protein
MGVKKLTTATLESQNFLEEELNSLLYFFRDFRVTFTSFAQRMFNLQTSALHRSFQEGDPPRASSKERLSRFVGRP